MGVIFHGRYNQNDLRSYPFVDDADRREDGEELPMDFLVDAAIRYPSTLKGVPYLASAVLSPTLVAAVVSLRLSDGSDVPLGWVNATAPAAQQYRMMKIIPLTRGASGWLVFGAAVRKRTEVHMAFSRCESTAFLPRVAREYHPPPITAIRRYGREAFVEGHVTVVAGNKLEVVQADQNWASPPDYAIYPKAMRVIDGTKRAAIVIRMSDEISANEMASYLGTCYNANEAECNPPIIKTLNRVEPDEAGNITLLIKGVPLAELVTEDGVPEGIVIDMPIGLIDVCDQSKELDPHYKPEPECD